MKVPINITIDQELFDLLEAQRGTYTFSAYTNQILHDALIKESK